MLDTVIVGGFYVRDIETSLHYMAVTRYDVRFYKMRYAGLRYQTQNNEITSLTPVNFASTLVTSSADE